MYQNIYLSTFLIKRGILNLKVTNIIFYQSINIKENFSLI